MYVPFAFHDGLKGMGLAWDLLGSYLGLVRDAFGMRSGLARLFFTYTKV